jgi:chromate transporter
MTQDDQLLKISEKPIAYQDLTTTEQKQRLQELAKVFLRLGIIGFGGPAAHIAMMDDEIVNRRQWMSREKLLDLFGITNLIPGPNSTELAIHIGYERAGWRGLLIAGSCFILPAMLIVWFLAFLYVQYQTIPQAEWLLYGIKPVIIAIIMQALVNFGKKVAKDYLTIIATVMAMIGYLLRFNEILLLITLALLVMLGKYWQNKGQINPMLLVPFTSVFAQVDQTTNTITSANSLKLFLFFLKIGSVLYGSGYVLLAFLQKNLVEDYQWLTSQQLLDAVAIGQLTPGPLFTTATFIGYLIAGNQGAIASTVGIFLPSFILVWVVNPWVSQLRQTLWTGYFLDGINAASLGLMGGVLYTLGHTALVDPVTIIITVGSAIALFQFKINSAWLVLAGGMIGFMSYLLISY